MSLEPMEAGAKGELPGPQNTLVKDGGELRIPFSIAVGKVGSGVAAAPARGSKQSNSGKTNHAMGIALTRLLRDSP